MGTTRALARMIEATGLKKIIREILQELFAEGLDGDMKINGNVEIAGNVEIDLPTAGHFKVETFEPQNEGIMRYRGNELTLFGTTDTPMYRLATTVSMYGGIAFSRWTPTAQNPYQQVGRAFILGTFAEQHPEKKGGEIRINVNDVGGDQDINNRKAMVITTAERINDVWTYNQQPKTWIRDPQNTIGPF